jgi:hypothetical protein
MTDNLLDRKETPDENQGSQRPGKANMKNMKQEYDGSTPPRVSPKLVGTLSGYSNGMNRLQKRQDYLEQRYYELGEEFNTTSDLARKDKIATEKKSIEIEGPKIGKARKALEELLPSLERKNRDRLENLTFDSLQFTAEDKSETE